MPAAIHYRNILCATDFSSPSRAALRSAVELARRFESALTLVHVYEVPVLGYPEAGPGSPFRTSVAELAGKELAQWKQEAERGLGRPVETVALEGSPWDQITKLAGERKADLVVVGTAGRSGLAHVLVGSVAERVVRHSPCPVLVARAAKE